VFKVIDFYEPNYIHFCDNVVRDDGVLFSQIDEMIALQVAVKEKFPEVSVMRAIPIPRHDLNFEAFPWEAIARKFEAVSDAFLIDTWVPHAMTPVPEFVGITGKLPDRDQCRALVRATGIPVILAGGLSPENVYDLVMDIVPAGADSCTLTNRLGEDGKPVRFAKDMRRVAEFCGEVLRAKRTLDSRVV
jgi:phosphoribosylanthranilate isomerase